jgi:benzoyl-CoA 2,3-dioxygenase component A
MRRRRTMPEVTGSLMLFFGARGPDCLPYFGPLAKVPDTVLAKHFAFSRVPGEPKVYVQDRLKQAAETVAPLLTDPAAYIYICGLKGMESGVDGAFAEIAAGAGLDWQGVRETMREAGRYHVETY